MNWRNATLNLRISLGISGLIYLALALPACSSHVYIKTFDYDADGLVDKTLYVARHRVVREDVDRDRDGVVDLLLHYNEKGDIFMTEYDNNADGQVELREEFFPNHTTRSSKDDDHDGFMDRSWMTYFNDKGQSVFMELDHDFDQIIDSKVDLIEGTRQDLVHGQWHRSYKNKEERVIRVRDKWLRIIFSQGEWIVAT